MELPEEVGENLDVARKRTTDALPGDERRRVTADVTAHFQIVTLVHNLTIGQHANVQTGRSFTIAITN